MHFDLNCDERHKICEMEIITLECYGYFPNVLKIIGKCKNTECNLPESILRVAQYCCSLCLLKLTKFVSNFVN